MSAVRIARRQASAIVLEADQLDGAGAGAIVVVKAEAVIVAAVSADDADVGGAAILGVEIRRRQAVAGILVEEAADEGDRRHDAALGLREGGAVFLAVLEIGIHHGGLEDVALEQQSVSADALDVKPIDRRVVEPDSPARRENMET